MKKCKRCSKIISDKIITGYCRYCYVLTKKKEAYHTRRKKGICIYCCKKLKPIYPARCSECVKKNRKK